MKSLIDENNKLKYEIENLQRAAKLFSEEVQNELRNDSTLVYVIDYMIGGATLRWPKD